MTQGVTHMGPLGCQDEETMMRLAALVFGLAALVWGQSGAVDRLGRTTPKSSFMGFLKSAHDGDFRRATRYLQYPAEVSDGQRVELARQLLFILDRGYLGRLDSLSSKPEGTFDDGLPADRESVGLILDSEQSTPVTMVRANENGQLVWLISRDTVEAVPQLFPEFGFPGVEQWLPKPLVELHFLSMPLWVLLGILIAFPLALAVSYGLCWLFLKAIPERWWTATKPSLAAVVFVGLILHNFASRVLGLPLLYRVWYTRVLTLLWLFVIVWAVFGVIRHLDKRAREYLLANQLSSTQSMLQLGRRLLQALVLMLAVLAGMRAFGYDITAALAGLGIGGLAVAFAAQKTLENVFGGLTLLGDGSIRVGDSVKFAATTGTVEDIGLRATRFRTVERSVLYVPNGQLAAMNIENLGQRDKILFRHTVGVKTGLSPAGMRDLLASLEELLQKDERVGTEGRRVRFQKIGAYSFDIELFAFILTNQWEDFLAIQQELLLQVMEIVRRHDTDFAFPSQTLYVEQGNLPAALGAGATVDDNVVTPLKPPSPAAD